MINQIVTHNGTVRNYTRYDATVFFWDTSLEVAAVTLDGLLDAQQHGGLPLVETGDRIELLHLEI